VRAVNKIYKQPAPAPAEPPADIQLLTEIRDLLKNR
jgi:large conductance mechanosensitive channel